MEYADVFLICLLKAGEEGVEVMQVVFGKVHPGGAGGEVGPETVFLCLFYCSHTLLKKLLWSGAGGLLFLGDEYFLYLCKGGEVEGCGAYLYAVLRNQEAYSRQQSVDGNQEGQYFVT